MRANPPLRILVVEDEALIALQLEGLLDDLGHTLVGMACASDEAITLARETRPDVALVDIHLGDGPTGTIVAQALSRDPRVSVVFMTANAARIPDDFAGALGVIAKPYSERTVTNVLRYLAECRAGRAPTTDDLDGFRLAAGRTRRTSGAPA